MHLRMGREALLHVVGVTLTLVVLWNAAELGQRDWNYPVAMWAAGDGPYYCAQTKILLETGWVFRHPDLAAPEGLDLHDFPQFEGLHLLIMKLIGLVVPRWVAVLNIFYVLTFVFATTTALAVFRHLKIPAVAALALAIVFSFQPYHFYHSQQHVMLSGYYLMPLQALVMVWLLSPVGLRDEEGAALWSSARFRLGCVIAFVAAFANHYYAAFFAVAWFVAAVHSAMRRWSWEPVVQTTILWGVVGMACTLNLAPSLAYWAREGSNRAVSEKLPRLVEEYGLRIAPMLMPIRNHRVPAMADLAERYAEQTGLPKREQEPIGLLAGSGLLMLVALVLFGHGRVEGPLPGPGSVTLVLLLVGTTSGLGAVFAWTVSPQLYGLDRMTPLLALLGLLAWGLLAAGGPPRPMLWAAIGGAALLDVLPPATPHHPPERTNSQFRADARFGASIQAKLTPGTLIHQLPSNELPHEGYSGLHLFLFTEGFRWTTPAMMNRPAARRNRGLEGLPVVELLDRLAVLEVGAVVIDRRRERGRMEALAAELDKLGQTRIDSGDGRSLYDVREWGQRARQNFGAEELQWRRLVASCPVHVVWGSEFRVEERGPGDEAVFRPWRWCRAKSSTLTLVNAHPASLDVRVEMRPLGDGPIHFSGPMLAPQTVEPGTVVSMELRVPPGRHELKVALRGENPVPEVGGLWFRLEGLKVDVMRPALAARR